ASPTESALLGEPNDVTQRVRDQAEGYAGHTSGLLHDAAAQAYCLRHAGPDVLDADEERDEVSVALQGADRGVQRIRHPGVDEGVARVCAFTRICPTEQPAKE